MNIMTMIFIKNECSYVNLVFNGIDNKRSIGDEEKALFRAIIQKICEEGDIKMSTNNEYEINDEVDTLPMFYDKLYEYVRRYKEYNIFNSTKETIVNVFKIIIECSSIKLLKEYNNIQINSNADVFHSKKRLINKMVIKNMPLLIF